MRYTLELSKNAEKFIKKLDGVTQKRIVNALLEIQESPLTTSNIKKMVGYSNRFRKRVGDIRIVYDVYGDKLYVHVGRIGFRGDVYKR